MKVYGVFQGCQYEGGGVQSTLFVDKNGAINLMKQLVKRENEHWHPDDEYYWKEKTETHWFSGCDYISVQEFDLDLTQPPKADKD